MAAAQRGTAKDSLNKLVLTEGFRQVVLFRLAIFFFDGVIQAVERTSI